MTVSLRCLSPRPMAERRLILFPFAGAGPSAFLPLVRALPPVIDVWAVFLPGREERLSDVPVPEWDDAVRGASAAIMALPALPLSVYGHSMGALLASDCAAGLGIIPILGAVPSPETDWAALSRMNGTTLIAALAERFGALPASMANPDIAAMAADTLKLDFALMATRGPRELHPEARHLVGVDDPVRLPHPARPTVAVPGGHYFIVTHPHEAAAAILS